MGRFETVIRDERLRVEPHVVVTFPIHGISGFHDHIVTHCAVTRVYLELHGPDHPWLQRLAFFTVVSAPADMAVLCSEFGHALARPTVAPEIMKLDSVACDI